MQQSFILSIILSGILLLTASCGLKNEDPTSTPQKDVKGHIHEGENVICLHDHHNEKAHLVSAEDDVEAQDFQYDIEYMSSMTSKYRKKLDKARDLISQVIAMPEFYDAIANVPEYTCIAGSVSDRTGVENSEEAAAYIHDAEITVRVGTYWSFSRAKAKAYSNIVKFNRRYSNRKLKFITNTLFHEMLHVAGFGHCGKNNPRRYTYLYDSVPYKVGDIMQQFIEPLLADDTSVE